MPVQDYNINTPDNSVGTLYGLQHTRADIQTGFLTSEANFGDAVQHDGTVERGYKVAPVVAGKVAGIVMRNDMKEANARPSTGSVTLLATDSAPIVKDGAINVRILEAGAYKAGGFASVLDTDGTFGITVAGGRKATTNVTFVTSGIAVAGDIVPVNITHGKQ